MTACLRRGTRRRKPNNLSDRLAPFRNHRAPDLGSFTAYLLGQDRIRKVVALALLLVSGILLSGF